MPKFRNIPASSQGILFGRFRVLLPNTLVGIILHLILPVLLVRQSMLQKQVLFRKQTVTMMEDMLVMYLCLMVEDSKLCIPTWCNYLLLALGKQLHKASLLDLEE